MYVLVERQHWLLRREPGELVEQDMKGPLLPLLRAQLQGRVARPTGTGIASRSARSGAASPHLLRSP